MRTIWQIIKGLFFIAYFCFILFIAWQYAPLTFKYNLPQALIPGISIISVLIIGFKFFQMYYRIDRLEKEFKAVVNHTFRTPLTRIMWYIKELEKDLPAKERLTYVEDISNAATKLLDIVDIFVGMQNAVDKVGYYFQAVSLRDVTERTMAKYRNEINKRNIVFQVSTFKDMPLLTVDVKKLSFVIDTLVENAIYYTPKNGKVKIDSIKNQNNIVFYVSDSGMGLTFLDKLRIFERFFRSKRAVLMNPDGMGLKLYLSKMIVKRHHGKLFATSNGKNHGTTFYMELPIKK